MAEKNYLVVTGGSIDPVFAGSVLSSLFFDKIFAAEGGAAFLLDRGIRPDVVISDFDSAGDTLYERLRAAGVPADRAPVRKDETDTGLVLTAAMEEKPDSVLLLGATGTRLDHVLGNIMLLARYAKRMPDVSVRMADPYNVISVHTTPFTVKKRNDGAAHYLSFFALEEVTGLTVTGVSYPLSDFTLRCGDTICVSNYLTEERAAVSFSSGVLAVIESADEKSLY